LTLYDQNTEMVGNGTEWTSSTMQSGIGDPAQSAVFHPGRDGEISVFRFTSPTSGFYDIVGAMGVIDVGDTKGYVQVNDVTTYATGEMTQADGSQGFLLHTFLSVGDTVDFAIGLGTSG
jgi:hypothetical protein